MARKPKPRNIRLTTKHKLWYSNVYSGTWWSRTRQAILLQEPWCRSCKVEPATEVDHIVPHRGDQAKFKDIDNLQPLCKACHSRKTQRGE